MAHQTTTVSAASIADHLLADVEALSKQNTPNIRAVRRQYSHKIRDCQPELALDLAARLLETAGCAGWHMNSFGFTNRRSRR